MVQETGLSSLGLTCTALDWPVATLRTLGWAACTGHPLLFLTFPILGIITCWVVSCTTMLSIILTILAICWEGVTVTCDICAIGAIMNGSLRISRNTVLKKVILPTGSLSASFPRPLAQVVSATDYCSKVVSFYFWPLVTSHCSWLWEVQVHLLCTSSLCHLP